MDTGDLIDLLSKLELTEYESKAYVAAVSLGKSKFSALADESGIPQQRIYDVVADLEERGLVEVHEGSAGKEAVAVPPEIGLEELKAQRIETYENAVSSAIEQLERQYQQVDASLGYVTVVNHESSVRRHAGKAIESAEWLLFLSLPLEWYRVFEDEIAAAVDRGVSTRLLVQTPDVSDIDELSYPEGLMVRHRPSADMLVAADRRYGVFRGIAAPAVVRPTLVTRDENIVEMLQRYSEQFWQASEDVSIEPVFPRRYLTPWHLIADLRAELDAGTTFEVYMEGHETDTGIQRSWEGELVAYETEISTDDDSPVVLPEVARLTVETDEGTVSVGGWDATLEDVAAHGLEVRQP